MPQTAIDLSQLPPPAVVEALDYEAIVGAITADLVTRGQAVGLNLAPALALETEPLTIAVEAFAYRELNLRNQFNLRSQANMLAFATGADLDNLAANLDAQRHAGELDPAFRARAVEAPNGWAVAGPLAAYDYIARNADPTVADIDVTSPTPGQVLVTVLSTDPAGVASAQLLASVNAALSADDVRPFTDQVIVQSAVATDYEVAATLTILQGPDQASVVLAATAAVDAYAAAQRKIDKPVRLAGLTAALFQPGVDNVVLTSPMADIPAIAGAAPILTALTITPTQDGAAP